MREIKAIIRRERLEAVMEALHEVAGLPGVTVSTVHAFARRRPQDAELPLERLEMVLCKLETIVPVGLVGRVVETIRAAAHTGRSGDGMIFVLPVEDAVRIRTGERGLGAL